MWETPAWGAATRRANQKEFPQNLTQILPPNLTPPPIPELNTEQPTTPSVRFREYLLIFEESDEPQSSCAETCPGSKPTNLRLPAPRSTPSPGPHSRPLCMNCNNNNNNNSRSSSSTVLGVIIHNDDDDRFLRKVHKLFKVLVGGGGSRGSALGVRSLTACAINQ